MTAADRLGGSAVRARAAVVVALAACALLVGAATANAGSDPKVWIANGATKGQPACATPVAGYTDGYNVREGIGPYPGAPGFFSGCFVKVYVRQQWHTHGIFLLWWDYSLNASWRIPNGLADFHVSKRQSPYQGKHLEGLVKFSGGPYSYSDGREKGVAGNPGSTSYREKYSVLFPKDDEVAEPTETYEIYLPQDLLTTFGHGFSVCCGAKKIYVHDNDVAVVSLEPARAYEGDALRFKAKLSNPSSVPLLVTYAVSPGTARPGVDYTLGTSTQTTIPAMQKEHWIDYVTTTENGVVDGDRTLTLTLLSVATSPTSNLQTRLSATAASAVGTIVNDDPAEVTIAPVSQAVDEFEVVTWTVSVSTPVTVTDLRAQAVPVSGGTATENVDWSLVDDGLITIHAGETTARLVAYTIQDSVVETTETFSLRLTLPGGLNPSLPSGVTVKAQKVVANIVDDDTTTINFLAGQQAGGVAVSGGPRAAGAAAQSNLEEWGRADEGERMAFTLRLGNPVSQAVRLRYATSVTTATGSASVDDFTMVTSGTMTFAANEQRATAYVQTTEDHVAEGDETFTIRFEEHPAHPLPPGVSLPGGSLAALGRIVDDDVRGVRVSPRELLLFESGTTTGAYTVRLATQPSTGVTVTPTSSAAGTATVAPASLSFGTGDWSTAQKVTVTAVADSATGDRTVTVSHAVSGYGTGNEAVTTGPSVAVTVVDDDASGVTVTPTALSMVEGGTGRYRVVLRTAPTSAVTVTVASSSGTVATASPGSLSFGTSDWSDAKTVTVTGATDDGDVNGTRQATLTHTVSGYGAVTTATAVAVTVTDDDQAGVTIEPLSLTLAEGAAKTYRVRLNYRPSTTTAVTVTPSVDGTLATVAPATLNYTQTTWSEWQTVTVTARANDVATGDRSVQVTHAGGGGYVGRTPPAVALTITDDDTAGVLVDTGQVGGVVPVPETGSVTWQVSLTSEPSTTTAVTVTRTAGDADLTASPDRLLFTAGDWSTTKTVTVRAATDADATDGSATFTIRASGYAADPVVVTVVEEDHTPLLAIAAPGAIMTVDETTGSSALRFPVTLTRAAADPGDEVRVAYQSSDGASPCPHPDLNLPAATTGTAVAGSDYTLTSGTLTFAARSTTATGTTTQTQVVKVPVLRTIDDEASYECLTMELGNAVKAALGRSATSGVIVDGDFPRVVSIAGTTVGEPLRARSTTATFTVNLDVARSAAETTVDWETEAGSASAGSDFVAAAGTVTFQRGEIEQSIDVTVLDDGVVEREETFRVTLSNPSANTSVGVSSATGTILSDDVPEVQVADVTVTESALPTTATFTVRFSQPAASVMRVAYATSASTALAGRDYAAAEGTLTFDVGDDERTIGVAVLDDDESEADETFALNLYWVRPGGPDDDVVPDPVAQATVTVYDDDRPGVPQAEVEVIEPDAGQTSATFVVRLEEAAVRELEYAWATADGTAEADSDYTAASGRLTFAVGETTRTVAVAVLGDVEPEADETFTLMLSRVDRFTGEPVDEPEYVLKGTILDDDWPEVRVGDVAVDEPYAGRAEFAEFEVRLAEAAKRPLEYAWETADGTAAAGSDYAAASGRLTFESGDTTKTVAVVVLGDGAREADETFTLTLMRVNRFTGEPEEERSTGATGTIRDNDQPDDRTGIEVADVAVQERDAGQTASAYFGVRLNEPAELRLEYAWETADGTAAAGSDYTAASGRLTFEPGETTQTVPVVVLGDDEPETNETFTLTLTLVNPFTGGLEDGLKYLATGTILDDDRPEVEVDDAAVREPDAGQTASADFVVRLAEAAKHRLEYAWKTADGTAKADSDYEEASGTITFEPGQTTQTAKVVVLGDDEPEADETFTLTLKPADRTGEPKEATGTILDDDQPVVEVGDVAVDEPDAGQTENANFGMRLATPAKRPLEYAYETADGTAEADRDYTAASGRVTFTVGESTSTVAVVVLGDDEPEADETFTLTLTPVDRFTGEPDEEPEYLGTGTIVDDDWPVIAVDDVAVDEPGAGQTARAGFAARLATPAKRALEYAWTTADGTAEAGRDYTAASGTITFAAGDAERTIVVAVLGDDEPEDDETFLLKVSPVNPDPAVAGEVETATGTIVDDDTERWRGRALAAAMTVFGQSVAGDAVEVIGSRGAMRSAARFTAVLDGHELWGAGAPAAALESQWPQWWWYGDAPPLRTLTLTELATDSSFDVLLDAAGKWSVWGSVTGGGFRTEGGAVAVDGLRITAYGGFDYRLTPDLLAGLALSYAHGAVDYEAPEVAPYGGEVGLNLYSVLPYAHWQPVDTLGLWGMLGLGAGNALLTDTIGEAETPLRLLLAAAGARQEVATLGMVALAVKADGYALWMRTEAARKVAAAAAEAQRVRVLVEGSTDLEVAMLRSLIRPTVELGVNWERTADTQGFGGEVGGAVALSNAEVGLQVTAGGRYLIRHVFVDDEHGDEWGARMGVEWNPDGERTGPWAAAATAWGYASGDAERLWATPPAELEVADGAEPGPGAELAVGYGLQVPDQALLTPYVGVTLPAAGALRYRLGLGLALGSATDLGMRWEDAIARSDPSIFRILFEGTHRW